MDLIGILITLVILAVIFGAIIWLVDWVGFPPPWVLPIKALVAIILIVILLGMVTGQVPIISWKGVR